MTMLKKPASFFVLAVMVMIFFVFAAPNNAVAKESKTFFWNGKLYQDPGPILEDALIPPDRAAFQRRGGGMPRVGKAPFGAGFYDTSEFLSGSISVGIILPESDGSFDASTEDWREAQEQEILSEIQSGLNWWKDLNPKAHLSFTFHFNSGRTDARAKTKYEPINRPSWTNPSVGQELWISEIMGKFGYGGDYFYRTRAFLNDMRNTDGTDWAFLIFVADDENNAAKSFSDGKFAFAYYGGPFIIMTYSNLGYGVSNMEAVVAHEMGHIFYALDQYYEASIDCQRRLGYLNYENQNSEYSITGGSCKSNVDSIMRGGVWPYQQKAIDKYAKGQIGWADKNSNNVPDAIDVNPSVSISTTAKNGGLVSHTGSASVSPKKNNNSYFETNHQFYAYPSNNITTSTISSVRFRYDQGAWQNALPLDGQFDSTSESFSFSVPSQALKVEIKAKASSGNVKTISLGEAEGAKEKIVATAGAGSEPRAVIFTRKGKVKKIFYAYDKSMKEGVKVAVCDILGSLKDEVVVSQALGFTSEIRIFSRRGVKKGGFKIKTPSYGNNIACGDVQGDGRAEIIVAPDYADEPWVKIFNKKGKQLKKFYAFDRKFRGGVSLATGDVDGDGKAEIIAGSGYSQKSQIKVFEADGKAKRQVLNPYKSSYTGGVTVAAGDVDGDGKSEIASAPLGSFETRIKTYRYSKEKKVLGSFIALPGKTNAMSLTFGDVDGNGKAEIISAMSAPRFQVKIFNKKGSQIGKSLYPFGEAEIGAYLAAGNL